MVQGQHGLRFSRAVVAVAIVVVCTAPTALAAFGGTCTPPNTGVYSIATNDDLDIIPADCNVVNGSIDVACDVAVNPGCICNVTRLDAFHLVERITGFLRIEGCPLLTNLDGLDQLKVIDGRTGLYDSVDNAYGFAVWIADNAGLTSLSGLQNLTAVGRGATPPGRVFLGSNPSLCGTGLIDWAPIVNKPHRVVYTVAGTTALAGGCAASACSTSCGCSAKCFGPGGGACQGYCSETTDDRALLIVSVVFATLVAFLISAVFFLGQTDRLGCRMSCYGKRWSYGKFPGNEQAVVVMSPLQPESAIDDAWADAADAKEPSSGAAVTMAHARTADPPPASNETSL